MAEGVLTMPDPTDPIDLDALLRLAEEASPDGRRWAVAHVRHMQHELFEDDAPEGDGDLGTLWHGAVADFIAAANPTTIAALVRRIRSLELVLGHAYHNGRTPRFDYDEWARACEVLLGPVKPGTATALDLDDWQATRPAPRR